MPAISKIQPPIATNVPGVLSVIAGLPSPIATPVIRPISSENQIHIWGNRTKSSTRNTDSPEPVTANTNATKLVAAIAESVLEMNV